MPNYRRPKVPGGTYFITQIAYKREPWLCRDGGGKALRDAIATIRQKYPFSIDAFVLLPDHFHGVLTLPLGSQDISTPLRLIKTFVSKHYADRLNVKRDISRSRHSRREGNLWQRRFWDHLIRDQADFERHCDYIHYNPVKHRLCAAAKDWPYSSFHRFVRMGIYPMDWGMNDEAIVPDGVWGE